MFLAAFTRGNKKACHYVPLTSQLSGSHNKAARGHSLMGHSQSNLFNWR